MKLAVVGTGYVGLVSGVCLSARGHDVTCVDVNPDVVARLNRAEPTIHEAGLPELLGQVIEAGRFRVTTCLREALSAVELVLVAVGTPSVDGVIDLCYVRQVAREIGEYLCDSGCTISVVIKSTVVPGTTDTVVRQEIEAASGLAHPAFGLGMNPEFLREGEAIADFASPDRIILGYEDEATLRLLEELYAPWTVDKLRVNTRTAELTKYANNALLATQISAVNEIANLAAAMGGIDILDVIAGVSLDRRWNPLLPDGRRAAPGILSYLIPGCGFGGSCFPKDVQALRSQGRQAGVPMRVLDAVLGVNEAQPGQVVETVRREVSDLAGRRALLLGLAFKPETDDVRETASAKIAADLLAGGMEVVAHDPVATAAFAALLGPGGNAIRFVENWREEVAAADLIVIATAWPEYRSLVDQDLRGKLLFDARRLLAASAVPNARYRSIGLSRTA